MSVFVCSFLYVRFCMSFFVICMSVFVCLILFVRFLFFASSFLIFFAFLFASSVLSENCSFFIPDA